MNLISFSALYATHTVTVLLFDVFFQVRDRRIGATMVTGQRRDSVYSWPTNPQYKSSVFFPTLSMFKSSSLVSMWHNVLSHSLFHIFCQFLLSLNIQLSYKH